MLPANPFLQTVPPRITRLLARLEESIWNDARPLPVWHAEATPEHRPLSEALNLPLEAVTGPFAWGKIEDQKWFKVEIPDGAAAGSWLHWPPQGECTAYVDGVPFYGFDVAHHNMPLPVGTREVWVDAMVMESGIWGLPGGGAISVAGCRFNGANLVQRDEAAWVAYHDVWFLYEVAREEHRAWYPPGAAYPGTFGNLPPVENVSVLYRRLLRGLDDAANAYDAEGLPGLARVLAATYAALPADGPVMEFIGTGHAHIDLVWLWSEKAGESKAVHTFATMNRLMELYPEFRFGYSQPASYEAVGRRAPELLEQVRRRIGEGRWEATGAAEVESDTNLSCGESLARSLVVGQRRFAELRGNGPARTMWLPDVFGYCAALPQILQQAGVPYFFTTKLTWCTINKFPYSSFVWRGPDGSEVLAFVSQDYGYNGIATPAEMRTAAAAHRQSDVHAEVLAPLGYGDGGGGTTEAICERMRRAKNLAGVPRARWGGIEEFFDRLEMRRDRLPVYQGELYLEYHRGVYTTHSAVKAAYRACERAMQVWESVRCATGGGEIDQRIWQRVIFTQFHDYIPGSSRQEVYDEGLPELRAIAANALTSAADELPAGEPPAVWNPLPLPRVVVVGGETRRIGPLCGGPVVDLPVVPGDSLSASANCLENGIVRAEFDDAGRITVLSVRGHEIQLAGAAGDFLIFPDHPHQFDAWDIDRSTLSLGVIPVAEAEFVSADVANGVAAVTFRRRLTARSAVTVRYFIEPGSPVLSVEYDVDWQDPETLLKVFFPTRYAGRFARYGAPFGSVLRSQQPGQEHDEAQWEVPGSRYGIVMDESDAAGLAVITEAKYGFSCRAGTLDLSLLRSPEVSCAREDAALRRVEKLEPFADIGRHRIRIALGWHSADLPREEQAAALAETLFTPVVHYTGGAANAGFLGLDGGESLQPCWAKPALDGNGWILRLHETLGRRGIARLRLAENFAASLTNLLEAPGEAVTEISFTPYQLVSVRITR